MAARASYNKNSSAVKRIMQEARELANDPSTDYTAAPLEDDIFEWHCTLRGPSGTEFEGGVYHFRILLPSEYPFRPPSIMMLTPNGRFELNTKICISFTNYHEELWQPAWGVRTAIIGLQGFFPLKGTAAVGVGALEYPVAERRRLAALSREWVCPTCKQSNLECLPDPPVASSSSSSSSTPVAEASDGPTTSPTEAETSPQDTRPAQVSLSIEPSTSSMEDSPLIQPEPVRISPAVPLVAPQPTRPMRRPSIILPDTSSHSHSLQKVDSEHSRVSTPVDVQNSPQELPPIIIRRSTPRPPIMLDTAICVLLVLVFALICRRVL